MSKSESKKLCRGCREDYYNQPWNSNTDECWLLANAKKVQRTKVGVWQNPPYHWAPQTTLNCHQPEGSVWIKCDDPRLSEPSRGFDSTRD